MSTNFNEICRFCLGRETDMSKLHHHGSNIVERVLAFAPSLKICVGDGLPEQACSRCIYRINDCYNFKELCEKSDKSLRQLRTKNVEAKPCIEESKIQNVEQAGNFLEVKVEDIKQEIENCDEIGDEDCLSLSDESLSRSAHDIILPSAETLQNQVHDITSVLPSSSSSKNQHSVQDPLQYLSCRNDMEMDEDNSAMNDNEESDNVPVIRVIIKETEKDEGLFIPGRSKAAYEKEYEKFSAWRKWQNINTTNEEVLLAYFTELVNI
ncbi:hypothetical protein C0J52_08786 [Blattella germanica]|nr:hypothetical protein C0J52_08786 [Blattella germanica]